MQNSSHGLDSTNSPPQSEIAAHRRNPAMGGFVKWILLALAFGGGWMAASVRNEHRTKETLSNRQGNDSSLSPAVTVTVEPVRQRAIQRTVEALGTLHGFESVTISARVEGRIRKIVHDVADVVMPGELLLEIDPTDYQLSVQQSDRALQVELAKLGLREPPEFKLDLEKIPVVAKARSALEYARVRQERVTKLAASKNSSAEDVDNAARDFRTAQAEYDNQIVLAESGLATVQMKQVELLEAREQLANTKVIVPTPTIPVPGSDAVKYVVSHRSISEGTLARPGMELFRIVISQTLKLRVPVPERHSAQIQLNQQVRVFTSTSATPFPGVVTRINPTVDETTRTFQVEIQVPNPDGALKPGSFAKAAILTRLEPDAVTIPLSALVQFAGVTKIFLAEGGRAREVHVTPGYQTTEWVEIVEPALTVGSQVVTSGQSVMADETPIVIRSVETRSDDVVDLNHHDQGAGAPASRDARR